MNMRKMIFGAMIALVTSSAMAADLSKAPVPIARYVAVPTDPMFYVGASAGTNFNRSAGVNALVGYQYNQYVALEGTYGYTQYSNGVDGHRLMANIVPQYTTVYGIKPYVVAGLGYEFNVNQNLVYNVGVGAKYPIASNVDLDVRYLYVNDFFGSRANHVGTIGLNYKF